MSERTNEGARILTSIAKESGNSFRKLATLTGIPRPTLQRFASGEGLPRVDDAVILHSKLGIEFYAWVEFESS